MIDILIAFAVWRVTSLLYSEDGPFDIFLKIRRSIQSFNSPFECFWCLSMWVAIPFALTRCQGLITFIIYWLAYSGMAILIDEVIESLQEKVVTGVPK